MEFSSPTPGICFICLKSEDLVAGVCDVCSYALRHAWQRAQGDRIVAISPRLVRSYVLVPRLKKDRSPSDVSGYEFLVVASGGLPAFDHVGSQSALFERLSADCGVLTWAETTQRCYLGYDGRADFSEVILAWSWGRDLRLFGKLVFRDFEDLLTEPSAEAGFRLGIKAAFEVLLWRAEILDEGNALCVPLRESAIRYLAAKGILGDRSDDVDDSMVEIYRSALSPDEVGVVSRLEEAEGEKASARKLSTPVVTKVPEKVVDSRVVDSRVVAQPVSNSVSESKVFDEVNVEGEDSTSTSEDDRKPEEGELLAPEGLRPERLVRPPESLPPGFARQPVKVRAP